MERTRVGRWWPFAALCVVTASRWILADQWPGMGSTLRTEAVACALVLVSLVTVALVRRPVWPGIGPTAALMAVGAGVLGAPAAGVALRGAAGEPFNRTLALCFVPLVVSVMANAGSEGGKRVELWPGLLGIAGALLLFPLRMPSGVAGYIGLILPVIAVAGACVWFARAGEGVTPEWRWAAVFGGGLFSLMLLEGMRAMTATDATQGTSWAGVGLDVMVGLLVVMSVERMGASGYASRFVVAPLLTVLEGVLLLRPEFSLRICIGMALLAGAAVGLWRRGEDAESGLRLLR